MKDKKFKDLSFRRDEKLLQLIEKGASKSVTKEEYKKLIRDYQMMQTSISLMLGSLLQYVFDKLISEKFDKLGREFDELQGLEQKAGVEALNNLHTYWHDLQVEFLAAVKGAIADSFGVESLLESFDDFFKEETVQELIGPIIKLEDAQKFVAIMARIQNSHPFGYVKLDEDEEKITLINEPCGSGMRLMQKKLYEPDGRIKHVDQPHAMTLERENFPSYCTHCLHWFVMVPMQSNKAPIAIIDPPKNAEDKCIWYIYKDSSKIPEDYLSMFKKYMPAD